MWKKEIVDPGRRRKLPEGFGWVDHRLTRENVIDKFGAEALALYLFLVTVGDADGVSWYADASIERRLSFVAGRLERARRELVVGGLIAYRKPHYQVLELPRARETSGFRRLLSLAAVEGELFEARRRQPSGTEGLGVSICPPSGIYRRDESACDALPVGVILEAMAGGAK